MVVNPSKANYCRRIGGSFYSDSKTLFTTLTSVLRSRSPFQTSLPNILTSLPVLPCRPLFPSSLSVFPSFPLHQEKTSMLKPGQTFGEYYFGQGRIVFSNTQLLMFSFSSVLCILFFIYIYNPSIFLIQSKGHNVCVFVIFPFFR